MTYPSYGNQPDVPPPSASTPPKKKSKVWLIIGIVAAVVALACVGLSLMGLLAAKNAPSTSGNRVVSTAKATTAAGQAPATAAPEPAAVAPKTTDFKLTPKILSKHCFGSAGCNIEFRIDVTYSGPALSESDTWLITYEVAGVEDGPMVDSIELTGTQFEGTEQSASTSSSSSKLKAKVTEIVKK